MCGSNRHLLILGGDSFLAARVVARLNVAFEVEMPLEAIFAHPSSPIRPSWSKITWSARSRLYRSGIKSHVRLLASGPRDDFTGYLEARTAGSRPPSGPLGRTLGKARGRGPGVTALRAGDPGDASALICPRAILDRRAVRSGKHRRYPSHNIRFTGRLDLGAMERAVVEIVRRHEVLRTCFPTDAGRPMRRILPNRRTYPDPVDLCGLPADEREALSRRLAADERARPFDLRGTYLSRSTLLCFAETDHILLWTAHHIAFDGWSAKLSVRAGLALRAFARDEPAPISEPPLQYADYAASQRESLLGEALEMPLAFWRASMRGASPVLVLPADRPRPATRTERGPSVRDARKAARPETEGSGGARGPPSS